MVRLFAVALRRVTQDFRDGRKAHVITFHPNAVPKERYVQLRRPSSQIACARGKPNLNFNHDVAVPALDSESDSASFDVSA